MIRSALVPDWRSCWRWWSIRAMSAALALQGAWLALPDDLRAGVPDSWAQIVTAALMVLGLAGRLVAQQPPEALPR